MTKILIPSIKAKRSGWKNFSRTKNFFPSIKLFAKRIIWMFVVNTCNSKLWSDGLVVKKIRTWWVCIQTNTRSACVQQVARNKSSNDHYSTKISILSYSSRVTRANITAKFFLLLRLRPQTSVILQGLLTQKNHPTYPGLNGLSYFATKKEILFFT